MNEKVISVLLLLVLLFGLCTGSAENTSALFIDYMITEGEAVILPFLSALDSVEVKEKSPKEKGTIVFDLDEKIAYATGENHQRSYVCGNAESTAFLLCFYCSCIDNADLESTVELYLISDSNCNLSTAEEIRYCSEEFQTLLADFMNTLS